MLVTPKIRDPILKLIIKYRPIIKVRKNEIYFLILLFGVSMSGKMADIILKKTMKISEKIFSNTPASNRIPIKATTKIKSKIK